MDKILDYVTPSELERFETEEFIKEDEQEEESNRLAAIRKPKGRPVGWRADMGVTYAKFVEMNVGVTQSGETEVKMFPGEFPSFSQQRMLSKRGKSFGRQEPVEESSADEDSSSVTELSPAPSGSVAAKRRPRGRPRVYSMVAAAGLGPGTGSQDGTSRDISPVQLADTSVDVGGPPSKKRRFLNPTGTSKSFSPELRSHSQLVAPVSANRPQVVIPNILEPDKHSVNTNQQKPHSLGRRCKRCKERKQRCDGARPCGRCLKAGIGDENCLDGDEVKFRKSIKEQVGTIANRTFARSNDEEDAMKSTIQSQPARSRRRSTSEASSDSIISGPTITVEA